MSRISRATATFVALLLVAPLAYAATGPTFAPIFNVNIPQQAGWVDLNVTSDRPLSSVSVNVDGTALGALKALGGPRWGRAFDVHDGATVRFTARATDGSLRASQYFTWRIGTGGGGGGTAPPPFGGLTQAKCDAGQPCDDLKVDMYYLKKYTRFETATFSSSHCAVAEGMITAGTHKLIRFDLAAINAGNADLKMGAPKDYPTYYKFSTCHGHYHFQDFSMYRLWNPSGFFAWQAVRAGSASTSSNDLIAAHPELRAQFKAGQKAGFCLVDDTYPGGVQPSTAPKYSDCVNGQGLSVGWADGYNSRLDGQWIVLDGLAAGSYILEEELNPAAKIPEKSIRNNDAFLWVNLTG